MGEGVRLDLEAICRVEEEEEEEEQHKHTRLKAEEEANIIEE